MTTRIPESWNPTPPSSSVMDRQAWLNEGGDFCMDAAEVASNKGRAPLHPPGTKLLKMEPDADST